MRMWMWMVQRLSIAFLVSLVLLTAACGTTSDSTPLTVSTTTATSLPTVVPPSLYVGVGDVSSSSTTVEAINPATGAIRWRSAAYPGVQSAVLVGNNCVYVLIYQGPLVALRASDGAVLWKITPQHANAINSPLVLDSGIIYISTGASSSTHGFVDAYRATDGKPLWEYDAGPLGAEAIAAASGVVYLPLGSSLLALRGSNGSVLWNHPTGTALTNPPTVANGTLYFNEFGDVYTFSAANGSQLWHFHPQQSEGEGDIRAVLGDGMVYAGGGTTLYALHASDGSLAWNKTFHGLFTGTTSAPGMVFVAWGDTPLAALRPTDGSQLWSAQLDGRSGFPPIVANNTLYMSTNLGPSATQSSTLYALNPSDGSVLWKDAVNGALFTQPVFA